jgi:pantoate--beta-alanine ligase
MLITPHSEVLRTAMAKWRNKGLRIALVPTMGNLHAGHISLVSLAQQLADRVVATIFVNPTQFVMGEDYAQYPRSLSDDSALLKQASVDLLFAPEVRELYPNGLQQLTEVRVPALDGMLCGKSRPGHFSGVATVVTKLFHLAPAEVAVFGEKDYQQLLVIKRLVRDLCFPIEIRAAPTARESDGLAMSSRNRYLDEAQRKLAPLLYQTLQNLAKELYLGNTNWQLLETEGMAALSSGGFIPDYVSIRRSDLAPPDAGDTDLRILAAAWLGKARLIDNLAVQKLR